MFSKVKFTWPVRVYSFSCTKVCQSIKWNRNLELLTSAKFPRAAWVLRPFTVHYKMVRVKGALSAGMLWNYDNSWAGDVDQASNSTRLHLERGHRVLTHVRQRTLSHHDSLQAETPWPATIFRHYATGLHNGLPGKAFWQVLQPNGREKRFLAVGTNGWGVSLASPSKSLLPPRQSFSWLSLSSSDLYFLILFSSTSSSFLSMWALSAPPWHSSSLCPDCALCETQGPLTWRPRKVQQGKTQGPLTRTSRKVQQGNHTAT